MTEKHSNNRIAILALVLSFGAFAISIYEANIMRNQQEIMYEEQKLMASQQKGAVWPYLVPSGFVNINDSTIVYGQTIKNKGVGPAKMENVAVSVNGFTPLEYLPLLDSLNSYFGFLENIQGGDALIHVTFKEFSGVLSPEEEIKWLEINIPRSKGNIQKIANLDIQYDFCYCSIYDDCWRVKKGEDEPLEGCEVGN